MARESFLGYWFYVTNSKIYNFLYGFFLFFPFRSTPDFFYWIVLKVLFWKPEKGLDFSLGRFHWLGWWCGGNRSRTFRRHSRGFDRLWFWKTQRRLYNFNFIIFQKIYRHLVVIFYFRSGTRWTNFWKFCLKWRHLKLAIPKLAPISIKIVCILFFSLLILWKSIPYFFAVLTEVFSSPGILHRIPDR